MLTDINPGVGIIGCRRNCRNFQVHSGCARQILICQNSVVRSISYLWSTCKHQVRNGLACLCPAFRHSWWPCSICILLNLQVKLRQSILVSNRSAKCWEQYVRCALREYLQTYPAAKIICSLARFGSVTCLRLFRDELTFHNNTYWMLWVWGWMWRIWGGIVDVDRWMRSVSSE